MPEGLTFGRLGGARRGLLRGYRAGCVYSTASLAARPDQWTGRGRAWFNLITGRGTVASYLTVAADTTVAWPRLSFPKYLSQQRLQPVRDLREAEVGRVRALLERIGITGAE